MGKLTKKKFEHAPELNTDSPAYDKVICELDKIIYSDPEDVAQELTLRDAYISIESQLGDFITPFGKTKEARQEEVRKLSEVLHLDLTLGTPIWKIVKDYESMMRVN
jgi:hypothetical protein